jgi:dienelactone hydrolase
MILKQLSRVFSFIILLPTVCAAYDFPKPTGQHAVGTLRYHMIDRDRLDPYDTTLFRELMVQVWYPTSHASVGAAAHYLPDLMPHMKRMANQSFYVPQAVLDYLLVDIKCYAIEGAPLLIPKKKFPVIILCHGLGSMVSLQTAHAENLASHGFVVFGINHTFNCSLSIFPDGRVYPFKFDWNASGKMDQCMKIVNLWQQDVKFVLSKIEDLADLQPESVENPFYHKLDLDKIGMFGHSMGGATTTQMCRRDARIKAGVNMDGPLFGSDYEDGFKKPYMMMVAENSIRRTDSMMSEKELLAQRMTRDEELMLKILFRYGGVNLCGNIRADGSDAYYVYFIGAGHNTFTDVPLVKEISFLLNFLEYFGLNAGTIAPLRAVEVTNKLLVDFFNKYLMHKPALILENAYASDQFPEVVISRP